jgi:hypothetical protein
MEPQRTVTLADDARASYPAEVSVSRLRWLRYYPKWPLIWVTTFAAATWATVSVSGWFALLAVPLFLLNLLYWYRVKEHFAHGCCNPGMVIEVNPTRIAVRTDLTKGIGEYPVIKILPLKLARVMGKRPEIGMRVPTAALYSGSADSVPHWSDFDPVPIECANGNFEISEQILEGFSNAEWQELEQGLAMLPSREPGLYHLSAPVNPPSGETGLRLEGN